MHESSSRREVVPAARVSDVFRTDTQTGAVVYDRARHQIHYLNCTAALVWDACDGHRRVVDIAELASLPEETVVMAVLRLGEANLLTGSTSFRLAQVSTRRSWLKAAVAVPIVATITAPAASAQVSTPGDDGGSGGSGGIIVGPGGPGDDGGVGDGGEGGSGGNGG